MGTLYYFCIFSVSLKLFINERFLKSFKEKRASPGTSLQRSNSWFTTSYLYDLEQVAFLCLAFLILKTGVMIVFNTLNGFKD